MPSSPLSHSKTVNNSDHVGAGCTTGSTGHSGPLARIVHEYGIPALLGSTSSLWTLTADFLDSFATFLKVCIALPIIHMALLWWHVPLFFKGSSQLLLPLFLLVDAVYSIFLLVDAPCPPCFQHPLLWVLLANLSPVWSSLPEESTRLSFCLLGMAACVASRKLPISWLLVLVFCPYPFPLFKSSLGVMFFHHWPPLVAPL